MTFTFTDPSNNEMLSIITTSHSMEFDEIEESSKDALVSTSTSDAQQTQSLTPTRAGLHHCLVSKVSLSFCLQFFS